MKRLTCKVQIGEHEFLDVAEVKVNSSYENLTDTATVTIPKKLSFKGKPVTGDNGIFSVGEAVRIYLGYDGTNDLAFSGFVTSIKPGIPIEIGCEDEMYALKRGAVTKSWPKQIKLDAFLKEVIPSYPAKCVALDLGKVRMNTTPAGKLNELAKSHSLKAFFRKGTLYVGPTYWPELQNTVPPRFAIQGNIIESELEWQRAEDVRIKVKAISTQSDNTKIEVELGDPEGSLRTLNYYNITKEQLKESAERDLKRFRFEGFKGSFTTFGMPTVYHGDRIELLDPTKSKEPGFYIVKSVERTFGKSGYRQKIELEAKV